MTVLFGPSGNSESFYDEGYKSTADMPKWLNRMGLDAYEYSCSRGVNIGEEKANLIGQEALKYNIALSIHAPYYINFANQDKDMIAKSEKYIIDSVKAAQWMGANRVVFHPGSCGKIDRKLAFETTKKSISELIKKLKDMNLYPKIMICPETMGKRNYLGTLEEVLELCLIDEKLIPTIDFGHINALEGGSLKSIEDFERILNRIEEVLGRERGRIIHSHFSRIEYTDAGEKKHWTLRDTQYGPEFEFLAPVLIKRDMEARIICESRGQMAEDSREMKDIYNKARKSLEV